MILKTSQGLINSLSMVGSERFSSTRVRRGTESSSESRSARAEKVLAKIMVAALQRWSTNWKGRSMRRRSR